MRVRFDETGTEFEISRDNYRFGEAKKGKTLWSRQSSPLFILTEKI